MTIEKRIEKLESIAPGGAEKCQRIIYQICSTKDDVGAAGPSDDQVRAYLEATGRCLKCTTRLCFLTWDVAKGVFR